LKEIVLGNNKVSRLNAPDYLQLVLGLLELRSGAAGSTSLNILSLIKFQWLYRFFSPSRSRNGVVEKNQQAHINILVILPSYASWFKIWHFGMFG